MFAVTDKESKPERMLRTIDDRTYEDEPCDLWECKDCGEINGEWRLNFQWVMKVQGAEKWVHADCKQCSAIAKQKLEEREKELAEIRRRELARRLIEQSEVPVEFRKLSGFEIRPGAREVFKLMNKKSTFRAGAPWIVIQGDNNTGKSVLLGKTVLNCASVGIPSFYFNECLFFRQVKESFGGESKVTETSLMDRLHDTSVIFWDEFLFFDYTEKEWIYERAYAIIEYAAEREKVIVFATNINSVDSRCGKRIMARLKRRGTKFLKMRNRPFF